MSCGIEVNLCEFVAAALGEFHKVISRSFGYCAAESEHFLILHVGIDVYHFAFCAEIFNELFETNGTHHFQVAGAALHNIGNFVILCRNGLKAKAGGENNARLFYECNCFHAWVLQIVMPKDRNNPRNVLPVFAIYIYTEEYSRLQIRNICLIETMEPLRFAPLMFMAEFLWDSIRPIMMPMANIPISLLPDISRKR